MLCINELQIKFDEVIKKVDGGHPLAANNLLREADISFTRKVVELALLSKFQVSQIDLYDGNRDPRTLSKHIEPT